MNPGFDPVMVLVRSTSRRRCQRFDEVALPAEDALALDEDELDDLVLVDHVHGHVPGLGLGSQQRGAEHDGHALDVHAVIVPVVHHSVQVFEERLHGVVVGSGQLSDQVFDGLDPLSVVWTLDGADEVLEQAEGEEWLRKLPEKHLQGPSRDVDVLPLSVGETHLLVVVDGEA